MKVRYSDSLKEVLQENLTQRHFLSLENQHLIHPGFQGYRTQLEEKKKTETVSLNNDFHLQQFNTTKVLIYWTKDISSINHF